MIFIYRTSNNDLWNPHTNKYEYYFILCDLTRQSSKTLQLKKKWWLENKRWSSYGTLNFLLLRFSITSDASDGNAINHGWKTFACSSTIIIEADPGTNLWIRGPSKEIRAFSSNEYESFTSLCLIKNAHGEKSNPNPYLC